MKRKIPNKIFLYLVISMLIAGAVYPGINLNSYNYPGYNLFISYLLWPATFLFVSALFPPFFLLWMAGVNVIASILIFIFEQKKGWKHQISYIKTTLIVSIPTAIIFFFVYAVLSMAVFRLID